jgi:hypothetical protein
VSSTGTDTEAQSTGPSRGGGGRARDACLLGGALCLTGSVVAGVCGVMGAFDGRTIDPSAACEH